MVRALEAERRHPPPSLEEAKLRFSLAANELSRPWMGFVRGRPYFSVGAALAAGLAAGRWATLRKLCGKFLKSRLKVHLD